MYCSVGLVCCFLKGILALVGSSHGLLGWLAVMQFAERDAAGLQADGFPPSLPRPEALSYGSGVWVPAVQDRSHLQRGDAVCQNPRCLQRAVHSLLPGTGQTKGAGGCWGCGWGSSAQHRVLPTATPCQGQQDSVSQQGDPEPAEKSAK